MLRRILNIFIILIILLFLVSSNLLTVNVFKISEYQDTENGSTSWPNQVMGDHIKELGNTIPILEKEFIGLNDIDKEHLINVSYAAVDDYFNGDAVKKERIFDSKFDNINNKVFIGFRINGRKKGSYSAQKNNLAESVYEATLSTLEDERYGGSITERDIKDLKIEIIILEEEKPMENDYEKGIHGLRINKENNDATYYNTVAIEGNYELQRLLEKLCKKAGLEEECSQDESVNKYYFQTIHFASTRFNENITTYYRCHEPEKLSDLNNRKIEDAFKAAKNWLFSNFNYSGLFNYEYYPSNGDYSDKNNVIRQLMASRLLALEVNEQNDLTNWAIVDRMHRKNLETILGKFYREDGELGYIYFGDKSKLGAMALAVRLFVTSPYFDKYEEVAYRLANTILEMQNEDGSFDAWYIEPDYSYDEKGLLRFYSGQAILSLVELYEKTGDTHYLDAAEKSQDYYLNEYVEKMEENYYPAYVPWHTIALYKLFMNTAKEKYRDAVFVLNDELIKMQNQDGKPYTDYLGRFFDPGHPEYGPPFSGSTAIYTEGLTYAYELAVDKEDKDRTDAYRKSILLGIHNLLNLQFMGADMYYLTYPKRVEGAIKYRVDDNTIRVDTTQHTIEALSRVLEVIQ